MKLQLLCITFFLPLLVFGQEEKIVYKINVQEEISRGMARQFGKAMDEATASGADYFLLELNTYGGMLDAADSMRTRLLNTKLKTIVFINNNAASAGALISIACEKIYMRKGSSIGAATVVDAKGEVVPDKYQSYMRSMMRSTAQARGRNPEIAEAMVDPRTYIEGINDSGKVLTFTSEEARANGYCDAIAESLEEVFAAENITSYKILEYKPTFTDKAIGFLINPAVSGILILIMLGGIYYELQSPGIGFPIMASIGAAVLYFAPLYLEGLAANWELLLTILGFALIMVEIFVLPGFGIAGISGILLVIFGLTTSMLGNDGFDFSTISLNRGITALAVVLLSSTGALVLFLLTGKAMTETPYFKKLVLNERMDSGAGYIAAASPLTELVGKEGIAKNTLRPSGTVEIDGNIYSAQAHSGFIEAGRKIVVIRAEIGGLFVKEQV